MMTFKVSRKTAIVVLVTLVLVALVERIFDFSYIRSLIFPRKELELVKHFSFSSPEALEIWKEKVLHKKVDYYLDGDERDSYVSAYSDGTCSAMYYDIKLNPYKQPVISWRWRIETFPDKAFGDDLMSKEEDDFAARLYVIFPALFFTRSKVLEYIWSKDIEEGTVTSSPYTDNIKLIVAESGVGNGRWVTEERDIYDDYLKAFGSKPKLDVGSIAFMCDSDSTKSEAGASFDDIKIYYKR